jgi:hypothetical protein
MHFGSLWSTHNPAVLSLVISCDNGLQMFAACPYTDGLTWLNHSMSCIHLIIPFINTLFIAAVSL